MDNTLLLAPPDQPHRQVRASTRDDWRTPPALMRTWLDRWRFTGDACADAVNTWAQVWIDQRTDALRASWEGLGPRVWMNPPYSQANAFMRRARTVSADLGVQVVALVPSTMDVRWFHEDAAPFASELWFFRGRISFVDPVTIKPTSGNPVGSVLVVFDGRQSHAGPRVGRLCSLTGKPTNEGDGYYWRSRCESAGLPLFEK